MFQYKYLYLTTQSFVNLLSYSCAFTEAGESVDFLLTIVGHRCGDFQLMLPYHIPFTEHLQCIHLHCTFPVSEHFMLWLLLSSYVYFDKTYKQSITYKDIFCLLATSERIGAIIIKRLHKICRTSGLSSDAFV